MSPHFTLLTDRAVNDSIAVFEGRERWQSGSAIRPRMAGNAVLAMIFGATIRTFYLRYPFMRYLNSRLSPDQLPAIPLQADAVRTLFGAAEYREELLKQIACKTQNLSVQFICAE
jgi:hypothetical protein